MIENGRSGGRGALAFWITLICVLLSVGIGLGYWWFTPALVIETAKPAETQKDGSIIVARAPDAKTKPKQIVPRGAKVERVIEIIAQGETPPEIAACTSVKCPSVKVDMSLVRLSDNTKRVLASSANGQIVGSVDIPVETIAPPPEPPKNAVGIRADIAKQAIDGIWYERDIWRARVRAEINQPIMDNGKRAKPSAHVGLGWTW